MVAFYILYRGVHGEPARKGDGKVVAEGAKLATLVGEIVDEFAVFAIFAGKDFAEFEDGSGEWTSVRSIRSIRIHNAVGWENGEKYVSIVTAP